MNNERHKASQTKADFEEKWSLDELNNLTIEKYVSSGQQTGFCYDIEHNTPGIGSMRGGSSLKFGLYRRADNKEEVKAKNVYIDSTGTYVWKNIIAENVNSAFQKIKQKLIEIAKTAQTGDLKKIDEVEAPFFWPVFKWKIAFMYAPEGTMVDIFSKSMLSSYSNNMLEAYEKILKGYSKDESIWDYSSKIWRKIIKDNNVAKNTEIYNLVINDEDEELSKAPLNQILFGPPGTGKTYNTINKALAAIYNVDSSFDNEIKFTEKILKEAEKQFGVEFYRPEDNARKKLFTLYKKLINEGQIEFVTFHQSYGYEEFIEGIKAVTDSDQKGGIKYNLKDGIFKKIAFKAWYEAIAKDHTPTIVSFEQLYKELLENIQKSLPYELSSKSGCRSSTILSGLPSINLAGFFLL